MVGLRPDNRSQGTRMGNIPRPQSETHMDNEPQNELEQWQEQARHWHDEAIRLRKELEAKQQVAVASPSLIDNAEFVADCCRYSENLLSKADVKRKWHFADDTIWTKLANDEALIEAIEAEKIR